MEQKQHKKFARLQIIIGVVLLALLIIIGWKFAGQQNKVSVEDCEFPAAATDLRAAGQKLSEEVEGTVGYSTDGKLSIESINGFVLLTPVTDEENIVDTLRTQITENLGCEGTSELSYWVFEVTDPEQLPPEILTELGTERPDQILLILGSLYVFSVDSLVTNQNNVEQAVTRIVTDRGGPTRSRSNSVFTDNNQTPGSNVDFGTTPAPAPLERTPGTPGSSGTAPGGGSAGGNNGSGGFTGGNGSGPSGGGRPVYQGGNPSVPVGTGGSGSQCTLKIVCEDPVTGDHYDTGRSGCYGADFYAQTPTPPEGTRQVALCVYGDGTLGGSCPDEYWFHYRNCAAQAVSLNLAGQNAVSTPEAYDAVAGGLPGGSPSSPGTLFTVPPTYANSPVQYTVRCSYPDQTKAIQCGMPGSGEYCLPGWNPVGCVAPPADFGTQ